MVVVSITCCCLCLRRLFQLQTASSSVCLACISPLYVDRGRLPVKGGGEPVASKFSGPVHAFEFDEFEGSGEFVADREFLQEYSDGDSDRDSPPVHGGMKYGYIG